MEELVVNFDLSQKQVGIIFTDDTKPIVKSIKPGSQASGKGIYVGLIITKLNETDITSKQQFKELISSFKSEGNYSIDVKFTNPMDMHPRSDQLAAGDALAADDAADDAAVEIHTPPTSLPTPIHNVRLNSDDGTTTTQI